MSTSHTFPDTMSLAWRPTEQLVMYGGPWGRRAAGPNGDTKLIRTIVEAIYDRATASPGDEGREKPELGNYIKMRWTKRAKVLRFYTRFASMPNFEVEQGPETMALRRLIEDLYEVAEPLEALEAKASAEADVRASEFLESLSGGGS